MSVKNLFRLGAVVALIGAQAVALADGADAATEGRSFNGVSVAAQSSLRAGAFGIAGSGVAAKGIAGSGVFAEGIAGSGVAARGIAGSGVAAKGIAGSGVAVKGIAGSGVATRGIAGSGITAAR